MPTMSVCELLATLPFIQSAAFDDRLTAEQALEKIRGLLANLST